MKLMRGFRNAQIAAPDLLEALRRLGRAYPDGQLCFCELGIGHPTITEHSARCIQARGAIAKAETR
jgi:hypothetical protein